jgi:hypothetical protein
MRGGRIAPWLGPVIETGTFLAIGGALAAAGIVLSFLYTGSALATTAIGR